MFDVTDVAAVGAAADKIVARHGRVDALVANAGISLERQAVDHSAEDWRRVMALNLDAVFFTTQAFARPMLSQGKGAVVLISSISGVGISRPERHVSYDVSKAGVAHMARSLGVEWGEVRGARQRRRPGLHRYRDAGRCRPLAAGGHAGLACRHPDRAAAATRGDRGGGRLPAVGRGHPASPDIS